MFVTQYGLLNILRIWNFDENLSRKPKVRFCFDFVYTYMYKSEFVKRVIPSVIKTHSLWHNWKQFMRSQVPRIKIKKKKIPLIFSVCYVTYE